MDNNIFLIYWQGNMFLLLCLNAFLESLRILSQWQSKNLRAHISIFAQKINRKVSWECRKYSKCTTVLKRDSLVSPRPVTSATTLNELSWMQQSVVSPTPGTFPPGQQTSGFSYAPLHCLPYATFMYIGNSWIFQMF